jgi:HAD superfamily hydrolase (TIGR01509 family)
MPGHNGKLEAVVFDCDGLLLETESRWTMAERATVERWGGTWSTDLKRRFLGLSVRDAATRMALELGAPPEDAPAISRALEEGFERALAEHGCDAMDGVPELLAALREAGVPVAVASNTRHELVRVAIAHSGLDTRFAAIVCAGNGNAPKPAPDVYLAACSELSVRPAGALALEDSQTGVEAARAAGMRVLGVPSPGAGALDADIVLESLAGVGIDDLERIVAR